MFALTLPVLIGLAGLVLGGARLVYVLWKGARVTAVEKWLATSVVRLKDATVELLRRNKEIDQAPPKTGDDLTDAMNDAWKKK